MPVENVVAESNVGKRQQVKLGHQITQSFYNMVVFSAASREEWMLFFEKGIGLYVYLSTFLGITFFKTAIYLYDLIVSKNKNIGKVGSFLREFLAMAILLVGIFGGLSTSVTMALAIPWLYVASLAVNVIFNLAITIQNAYQWLVCHDETLAQKYKESFIKHLFTTFIVSLLATALTFFMGLEIVPTVMAIASACIHAVCFALGAWSAYQKYQSVQYTPPIAEHIVEIHDKLAKPLQQNHLQPQKENDCYFYQKSRSEELIFQYDPTNYLLKEINDKIVLLQSEMNRDQNKFFSQKNKRLNKIEVLEKLKLLMSDPSKTKEDFYAFLKSPIFSRQTNNPFQSFFKQKSDVQDIFEAAEINYKEFKEVEALTKSRRHS